MPIYDPDIPSNGPSGIYDPDDAKPRTSLWEDVKIGYTDVANTLDTAGTLTWAGLGKMHGVSNEAYDEYANNLKRRRKMRQDAANPEGKEQGFSGKLTSLVGSLPGQIAALPFAPIETGMNALDAGESGTTTTKLVALDTLSSALGLAIPGFGGTLLKRGAKGAAVNTAQEYLTREAMSRTAETPKMKEALAPNLENMALAAVLGGGTSAAFGKNKPKTNQPVADTSNIDGIVQSAKVLRPVEDTVETRTNESSQYELFDQPEMGRVANPYEAKLGDWRVDENGIPIKADLSMEAQQLQEPLQRNLWGDELLQTRNPVGQNADLFDGQRQMFDEGMQEGIPLTEAIDSMGWAQKRGAINSRLKGEIEPSGELLGAIAEANNQKPGSRNPSLTQGPGGGQRGAIDPDLLTLGFTKLFHGGKEFKTWNPRTIGSGEGMAALGPGLYAGDNAKLGDLYKKYGRDHQLDDAGNFVIKEGVLNEMAVDTSRILNMREASEQLQQAVVALDKLGFKASSRGIPYAMNEAQKWGYGDKARKALVDSGVDGLYVNLGDDIGKEIVIFNPDIIAQISRADTPVEKRTGITRGPRGRQMGAIDIEAVLDGVRRFKRGAPSEDLLDAFKGTFYGEEVTKALAENNDPLSHERLVWMSPDDFHEAALKRITSYGRVEKQDRIRDALKTEEGLSQLPQLFIKPNDKVPGEGLVVGHEGRHRMDVFKESGIDLIPVRVFDYRARNEDGPLSAIYKNLKSQEDTDIPFPQEFNSQKRIKPLSKEAGVLNFKETLDAAVKAMRARYGAPHDSLETPISPENIVAKEKRVAKTRAAHEILGVKMPEWTDVTTQEEALHLASKTGDIASSEYTRGSASGLNYMAAYHKHPVLRYMRKLTSDAREQAVTFSKTYITAENGLSTYIKKMSDDQKLKLAELMTSLDKHQVDFTEQLGRQIGLDDNSIAFMNRNKETSDAMWSWSSKIHGDQGVKDAPKRKGYSPSVYGGDYFTLVTDTKGEIVAVISANTPGEFAKAISYYKTKNSGYKFGTTNPSDARARFTGSNRKALQFADVSVILSLLTDEAGGYNKLQSAMDLAAIKEAHTMYNFNMHNKRKKGLPGNLGNKPWLSAEENARDRLDATIRFYEEGAEYFAAQRPIEEANILANHPNLADKPNLRKYMQEYVSNIEGRYVNQAGKLVNEAFGLTSNLVELATKKVPFVNDYVSPGNTLKAANWTKNKMAQMYMGWFNFPFLAAQLMQPIQTGIPMMQLIGDRIGVDSTTLYGEMIKAGGEFSRFTGNKFLKSMGIDFRLKMDELTTEALEWGRLRGILDFTELERAYEGHKTKAGRVLDDVAEWSMQAGESMTRAPMFLAVVRVLDAKMSQEGVIDRTGVFEIAEKVTNQIMADYHHWERPTMYTGLGVVAPHAGGLTTFKHNYVGTQVLLAKEMAKGNASPMLLSMAQMAMFAGITGIPFYDEFDGIYQEIKDWFGDRSSISQDFLKNLPTWAKNGVISSMVDLNVQGKFSSADMKPDTLAKALFPHLSGAYEIGNASFEALSKGTEASVDNALVTATPSAWKQASKYALQRGPNGELYDKFGNTDVTRSEEDWKIAATTGMTPLDEAMDRNNLFQNKKNEKSRNEDMISTAKKFKEAVIDDADPERIAEILNKYQELGGDAASLIQQIPTIKREQSMSSQERAQGTPTTPQGVRRYEGYQR